MRASCLVPLAMCLTVGSASAQIVPSLLPVDHIVVDWTDGCIAVSNEEMELLWQAVLNGTVIDILP